MEWLNPPAKWQATGSQITVKVDPKTDFWRKTHYGFIRDNGHFYFRRCVGDFCAQVKVVGDYGALYDQAGLMLRLDETTWLKCGIELVGAAQQASVVVTRDFSDWSVLPLGENVPALWLRVIRTGGAVEVFYSLDGAAYSMLRQAYLTEAEALDVGLMCAAPDGDGFAVTFDDFTVEPVSE